MVVSLLILIFACSIAGAAWLDFIFTKDKPDIKVRFIFCFSENL